jgi:hypothetical protein
MVSARQTGKDGNRGGNAEMAENPMDRCLTGRFTGAIDLIHSDSIHRNA